MVTNKVDGGSIFESYLANLLSAQLSDFGSTGNAACRAQRENSQCHRGRAEGRPSRTVYCLSCSGLQWCDVLPYSPRGGCRAGFAISSRTLDNWREHGS